MIDMLKTHLINWCLQSYNSYYPTVLLALTTDCCNASLLVISIVAQDPTFWEVVLNLICFKETFIIFPWFNSGCKTELILLLYIQFSSTHCQILA